MLENKVDNMVDIEYVLQDFKGEIRARVFLNRFSEAPRRVGYLCVKMSGGIMIGPWLITKLFRK